MPLQEFPRELRKSYHPVARIAIYRTGRVFLNADALEQLRQPTHVVLLFDRETLDFGIRYARSVEPHAYKLRVDPRGRPGATVSAQALWRFYNIDVTKYQGGYDARLENNVLVISLAKGRHPKDGEARDETT